MYSFRKEERLCNKRLLDKLFHNGSSFLLYPFRIVHLSEALPAEIPSQVVIGVPKRKFKRAVDRNLIKRRIREAFRLNKEEYLYTFLRQHNVGLIFSINFVGKEIGDYAFLEKKLIAAMKQLTKSYDKDID
ncbi:ribonuclease P protein component [Desertivirga xinjiangensis]|uniref:ribonuclease P protein component n=1 Tax=Desertivirga xinjiangensis TaxID=539206 RepID=UPI00210CC8AE|nr:ribonuclease P protein component [Pedobacter xinjiangensis]